jgi:hypothetical protein
MLKYATIMTVGCDALFDCAVFLDIIVDGREAAHINVNGPYHPLPQCERFLPIAITAANNFMLKPRSRSRMSM